jgi:RimJ/RimL family protein N-acetyltransferase
MSMTAPMLRLDRMALRLPDRTDAERLTSLLNNFAVSGNLARVPYPYYRTDADAYLRTRHPGLPPRETTFAIDLNGIGFAGQVGFHLQRGGAVLGYWLGEPYWNKGYMSEAVRGSVDWFFQMTGDPRIISGVFAFNHASLAIQKKLGFTQTGTSRLLCLARGEELEHIDTVLTRSAWMAWGKDPIT